MQVYTWLVRLAAGDRCSNGQALPLPARNNDHLTTADPWCKPSKPGGSPIAASVDTAPDTVATK